MTDEASEPIAAGGRRLAVDARALKVRESTLWLCTDTKHTLASH